MVPKVLIGTCNCVSGLVKEMLVTSSGEHLLQILLLFSVHALVDLRSHIMVLRHIGG